VNSHWLRRREKIQKTFKVRNKHFGHSICEVTICNGHRQHVDINEFKTFLRLRRPWFPIGIMRWACRILVILWNFCLLLRLKGFVVRLNRTLRHPWSKFESRFAELYASLRCTPITSGWYKVLQCYVFFCYHFNAGLSTRSAVNVVGCCRKCLWWIRSLCSLRKALRSW